jgi:hypothetical protein
VLKPEKGFDDFLHSLENVDDMKHFLKDLFRYAPDFSLAGSGVIHVIWTHSSIFRPIQPALVKTLLLHNLKKWRLQIIILFTD